MGLLFILLGVVMFVLGALYSREGYDRKNKKVVDWSIFVVGITFMMSGIMLFVMGIFI